MSKSNLEIVLCRTCIRDNPGEGDWTNFDAAAQSYQKKLKLGMFKKVADLKYQNCFAKCENFHCVQINRGSQGYLLKKISTPEKQAAVIQWLERLKADAAFQLPESLSENLISPVKVTESYLKY